MPLLLIFFIVCFAASTIGAICGIGGGIIIKPVLDAFHVMDVATINFLSGCTVLSMTTYSVIKGRLSGESHINKSIGFPLGIGAALGGLAGKWMFSFISALSPEKNKIGAIQAICLSIITLGTLIYTICKKKISTHNITNPIICILIGLFLGIFSSFLGIGGGPINLVVLFYFFSMQTKAAAENSLYIIFFSQIANLMASVFTGSLPEFNIFLLILMIIGGITGGVCGRLLNKKIQDKTVDKLFLALMVVIIMINLYNIYIFIH